MNRTGFENLLKASVKSEVSLTLEVVTSKMSNMTSNLVESLLDAFKRDDQEQKEKGLLMGPTLILDEGAHWYLIVSPGERCLITHCRFFSDHS